MSNETAIEKLSYIRKVTGFANLGVLPSQAVVERAASHAKDLQVSVQAGDLAEALRVIEILAKSDLPSQAICQAGTRSVEELIVQLRADQKNADQLTVRERGEHGR